MVLFLILCIPCTFLLALQFLGPFSNPARLIRNPVVIGAATFFLYSIVDNATSSLFSDLYLWQDAFVRSAIGDQLLPIFFAIVFFVLFFRKFNLLPPQDQQITFMSFLAGFFFLLSIRDLIVQINVLDSVDLFYRPIGKVVLLVVLPWSLAMFRTHLSHRYSILANVFIVHLLIAFACAAEYMNTPLVALVLILIALAEGFFVLVSRHKADLLLNRIFRA